MSATTKAGRVEAVRTEAAAEDVAIFSAYTITATFWLLFTTAVGLLLSFKFPYPDWATSPMLSFGRLRAIHTNGTFYGWATIALVGSSLYVAARTSGISLVAKRWAWVGLWCFNAAARHRYDHARRGTQLRRSGVPRVDLARQADLPRGLVLQRRGDRAYGRRARRARDLHLELVHNRRFRLHHHLERRGADSELPDWLGPSRRSRLLHAQRRRDVVHVPRAGRDLLRLCPNS